MDTQTITQTINVQIANSSTSSSSNSNSSGNLANTGSSPQATLALTSIALVLIIASLILWRFTKKKLTKNYKLFSKTKLTPKIFSIFTAITVTTLSLLTALVLSLSHTFATPTLTLGTNQNNIDITIPQGGGTATATTTITTGTTNPDGYQLTADLQASIPGITIKLKGGDVTNSTNLVAGNPPLELKTTTTATSNDQTEVTLDFTLDNTVTAGTKELKLNYKATDNQSTTPTTMQGMTQDYCQNNMTIYDGSNPSAILTLADTRGNNQTYQVAKLADNNCWMLNNLKLGSTSTTTLLTPQDSNIASDFILPQLTTTGTADYDNPGAYGPVPGDTGTGDTDYGYLYNWPAVTAGESRTSHPETAGNAPHSICPKNWRLPIGGADINTGLPLATNEFNELSAIMAGFPSGQDSTYLSNYYTYFQNWQLNGPFKGTFAGYWNEGFGGQGVNGNLWSSSANPDDVDGAFGAYFFTAYVSPGSNVGRPYGFGIRCLL